MKKDLQHIILSLLKTITIVFLFCVLLAKPLAINLGLLTPSNYELVDVDIEKDPIEKENKKFEKQDLQQEPSHFIEICSNFKSLPNTHKTSTNFKNRTLDIICPPPDLV